MAIKTVVDRKGDVWTGKEVERDGVSKVASAVMTLGLSECIRSSTTVKVNGQEHSGSELKK